MFKVGPQKLSEFERAFFRCQPCEAWAPDLSDGLPRHGKEARTPPVSSSEMPEVVKLGTESGSNVAHQMHTRTLQYGSDGNSQVFAMQAESGQTHQNTGSVMSLSYNGTRAKATVGAGEVATSVNEVAFESNAVEKHPPSSKFVFCAPNDSSRKPQIPLRDWEVHRRTIEDLYIQQGKTVYELIDIMATKHGFVAK